VSGPDGPNGRPGPQWRVTVVRLAFRGPLDGPAFLDYLRRRAISGVEEVADGAYRRTVSINGAPAVVEVRPSPGELRVRGPAATWARRLFSVDADVAGAVAHLAPDPIVGPLVQTHPGRRPPGAWDPFELGVRAIVGQQVSVSGASTLAGRLAAAYGVPFTGRHGLTHLFPTPETLVDADLDGIGLTSGRRRAVRAFAGAVAAGSVPFAPGPGLVPVLLAVPGLGPWTAEYIALRLGDPDAFPASDLGLQRAVARRTGARRVTASDLATRAEAWRPWRATAAIQLWLAD
jgi:AraC family transcriptional regulator, regulatory protein of adaptative response / DNA-3-methyladenine glycosylase II